MIDAKQARFAPQWGEILTERLQDAGFQTVDIEDMDDVGDLYQIGEFRVEMLENYINWYGKYGQYKIDETEEYEIYRKDETTLINFSIDTSGVEMFRIMLKDIDERDFKGVLYLADKSTGEIKKIYFQSQGKSIVPCDSRGEITRFKTLSSGVVKLVWRAVEIAKLRKGNRV